MFDLKRFGWRTSVMLFGVAAASLVSAAEKPVSYYQDLVPVLKRSCNGCHHPGKLKGQLDLTSYGAFKKGGKHGPGFLANKPK